jgi:exodeoxyribonuclease V gamma subunit
LRRADDDTADMPDNPLLRSWGRDAREMQLVLTGQGAAIGEYRPVAAVTTTLLGRIQADVRADRAPAAADEPDTEMRPLLDHADDSIRIHSCHGRSRQVEVLRDAVLHLLESDPSLEPRDVIIMCPDIEVFAPLIHGAFGAEPPETIDGSPMSGTTDGIPSLRLRLADRSLRQTNPLLAVADFLLELATGRITASQVLDLASREPVRRRFRFDDDDLSRIEGWVAEMGVRWGLDGNHRVLWGLPDIAANTWSAGLDRLLLGVTMADEKQRLFEGTLPLDDVPSSDVELAGRLTELIDRLATAVDDLKGPRPTRAWRDALLTATEGLAASSPFDPWQDEQLHRVLDEVVYEADGGEAVDPYRTDRSSERTLLDLAEVRSLLGQRLKGRPTRANFRTGDLTVCTLVPMRSVPHRVVCLLGLDDGVFPRHTARDGDDLLIADPYVGDRDERSEDRQLLLDAVLAATDQLIIIYSGRDERTNRRRPPAVPIAELLDVIDRTVRLEDGRAPRGVVVVDHPLQSFDPRNFTAGELGTKGPWGFDPLNLEGARALGGQRRESRPFLSNRLSPRDEAIIQLESLVRFVEHPVRAFLRERLGVYAGNRSDQVADSLPIDLDPLERWNVGDRLLNARLAGATAEEAQLAERARGGLPPGCLADPVLDDVCPTVEALVEACARLPDFGVEPRSMEVNVRLLDGRLLVGTVPGVRDATILRCLYSKLGPKHRLAAWVRFLALSAAWPDLEVAAVTVGRGRRRWGGQQLIRMSTLGCLATEPQSRLDRALHELSAVVDLYERGLREPLPIYCETSAAWAQASHDGEDPGEAAYSLWASTFDFPCEDKQPEHTLVLGGVAPFDRIRSDTPRPDEAGPGWPDEPCRLGRLALRLWDGPLRVEKWHEQ